MKVVVVLSGGLDSTTLLYQLVNARTQVTSCVSFNYGQKHKKELDFASRTCRQLGIKHHVIDLWSSGLTAALDGSSSLLQGGEDIPEGHYAEENMKSTIVPNRNMIMLAIAGAVAVAEGANVVAIGAHGGDHFIYPDCRPDFMAAATDTLYLGNEGVSSLFEASIFAPYLFETKEAIGKLAYVLNVPILDTWSCYKGGELHCGRCGTCTERKEALGLADPTPYED